ncbi:protein TIC 22-like, chloroplastic isoform X2 [Cornus florida]|uniref:protein TIC 22-like, chloroplastic isoform X2 n=1 Tax=Cornus florida TaxID=4283 RepID=UPI00289F4192|nr:protein TIC 22-like, chloroplastic isoform X2 [Cornus florida]
MNFLKSKQRESSSPQPKFPQFNLQQAITDFQNHCYSSLQNHHHHHHTLFNIPLFSPKSNPYSLKTHLESTLSNLQHHAKQAIESGFSSFRVSFGSGSSGRNPVWGRIAERNGAGPACGGALSTEAIEERLAGVPVYALSNSSQEFVLISGVNTGKSLGLFCFKEEDAEALLEQMKSMDPGMRQGSKVVAVALNKVFQLKLDGVAFRLIPETSQIKNALRERQKAGLSDESFFGVPVFQSRSLILRSQNKRYRPVFFRKEDLENSLLRASRQQKQLNPVFREGDIQVAVLEDIIQGMKDNTTSKWHDVVFVPPGFDVSTDTTQQ